MSKKDLSKYNFAVLVDKSGSMGLPDTNGKTRWENTKEAAIAVASKAAQFDEDGILVGVFGSQVKLYDNQTADKVAQIFNENEPSGSTNTAGALKAVFDHYHANPAKPIIIIVITDGEPDDRNAVDKVIRDFAETLTDNGSGDTDDAGISFLQAGNDTGAAAYLSYLDDNLNAKFDIVDVKTMADTENMPLSEVLLQALEG